MRMKKRKGVNHKIRKNYKNKKSKIIKWLNPENDESTVGRREMIGLTNLILEVEGFSRGHNVPQTNVTNNVHLCLQTD